MGAYRDGLYFQKNPCYQFCRQYSLVIALFYRELFRGVYYWTDIDLSLRILVKWVERKIFYGLLQS